MKVREKESKQVGERVKKRERETGRERKRAKEREKGRWALVYCRR